MLTYLSKWLCCSINGGLGYCVWTWNRRETRYPHRNPTNSPARLATATMICKYSEVYKVSLLCEAQPVTLFPSTSLQSAESTSNLNNGSGDCSSSSREFVSIILVSYSLLGIDLSINKYCLVLWKLGTVRILTIGLYSAFRHVPSPHILN